MEIMNLLQKEGRQHGTWNGKKADSDFYKMIVDAYEARMTQLQDEQKEAEVTCEATEKELELEAQLVEARGIIQEQASIMSKHFAKTDKPRRLSSHFDAALAEEV
ncbi:uncharacterized protein LOC122051140 isoform X3 [Zingiber officinale]|uniref:uncharacterized protein LOC122051140 isoform X3 n=1 Tax=Zingiber officinale TaxID=94328 RepID=UPI001C4CFFAC|nr:uncharacterized protein LOC122051140 isoform X3 [Zingiber officinale]XP_042468031.1 uncharacterized protein LOC122051140 isoform X3 [Zingiber officinale]